MTATDNVVHEPYLKSEMDLFQTPFVDLSAVGGGFVELNPIASVDGNDSVEFYYPSSSEQFLDLTQTLLRVKAEVTKGNGAALETTDKVAMINNSLHSMFSHARVALNDVDVLSTASNYAIKSYIETVLNNSLEVKKSILTAQQFHIDDNVTVTSPEPETGEHNKGLDARYAVCRNGVFEMVGRVHADIFNCTKFLLPGVAMKVKFTLAEPQFVLMTAATNENYTFKIREAQLVVYKVDVSPTYSTAIERSLQEKDAAYEFTRTETLVHTITGGLSTKTLDNLFPGILPKRITIVFVKNSAWVGSFTENPLNFHHHNMSRIVVRVDGRSISHPVKTNFDTSEFASAFMTLYGNRDGGNADPGCGISMEEYKDGFTATCYDLTPDNNASTPGYVYPDQRGNLSIEFGFREPLTDSINVVILSEFDSILTIDEQRVVTTSFSD